MSKEIVGILLAAGRSTRFGSDKLLHPLDSGRTVGEQSALNLVQACPISIAVVAGSNSPLAQALGSTGLKIIDNTHNNQGMGSSIACGVRATVDADAWLIALADMPFIQSETIENIMKGMLRNECITAPEYRKQRGHPVAFSKHFRAELLALSGDAGAKRIISENAERLALIKVDDPGVLHDVDMRDDINP